MGLCHVPPPLVHPFRWEEALEVNPFHAWVARKRYMTFDWDDSRLSKVSRMGTSWNGKAWCSVHPTGWKAWVIRDYIRYSR